MAEEFGCDGPCGSAPPVSGMPVERCGEPVIPKVAADGEGSRSSLPGARVNGRRVELTFEDVEAAE